MEYYMHILPGEILIRTSLLQNNEKKMSSVRSCLRSISGVIAVQGNKARGSLLIAYDKRNTSYLAILRQLQQQEFMPAVTWGALKVRAPESAPKVARGTRRVLQ
jgi:hypothetical protein